ncbi:MAG: hypothetical protein V3U16_03435 [Candidatus Neomarinimicrobiota bacterium]
MDRNHWLRAQTVLFFTSLMILICSTAVAQSGGKRQNKKAQGSQIESKEELKDNNIPGFEKNDSLIQSNLSIEEQAKWNDGKPPGWSRGEKKGWEDANIHPGLAKKGKKLPPGLAEKTPAGWEKSDYDDADWDDDDDD